MQAVLSGFVTFFPSLDHVVPILYICVTLWRGFSEEVFLPASLQFSCALAFGICGAASSDLAAGSRVPCLFLMIQNLEKEEFVFSTWVNCPPMDKLIICGLSVWLSKSTRPAPCGRRGNSNTESVVSELWPCDLDCGQLAFLKRLVL